jgi:hypothetical protein
MKEYPHLASQVIDASSPGSVLADFETLLGFVGEGVLASGQSHLLPMGRLFELDERMANPLRPRLKRPQLRSFPHLNGLHWLLRASQLGIVEPEGKSKQILRLDVELHAQWRRLNPTERYFNLLEAWLRHARWEMIGLEEIASSISVDRQVCWLWQSIPDDGWKLAGRDKFRKGTVSHVDTACLLALLELFGLITIQRETPVEGQNWNVAEIHRTAYGDELLSLVADHQEMDIDEHEWEPVTFGVWQEELKPHFPEWVNNLEIAPRAFREGVYFFMASLGDVWRRIAIPADATLDDLAVAIIEAYKFDNDHLYQFDLIAPDGRFLTVSHPFGVHSEMSTNELAIGHLPLNLGDWMRFLFDFGDEWLFDVELEKIDQKNSKYNKATLVKSKGRAPRQYNWDNWG